PRLNADASAVERKDGSYTDGQVRLNEVCVRRGRVPVHARGQTVGNRRNDEVDLVKSHKARSRTREQGRLVPRHAAGQAGTQGFRRESVGTIVEIDGKYSQRWR